MSATALFLPTRDVGELLALCASLAVGCALAFGWTRLAVGQLNSATAFLGSVVAGNGINFGIILAGRYREELRSRPHAQALAEAMARTVVPTLVAAMAAAAAYLSLLVTDFRGFSEFGAIAGVGMIFCWATTFLVLPALLDVLRLRQPEIGSSSPVPRMRRFPSRAASIALLLGAAGSALAGGAIVLREPFEDDLGALRSRSLPVSEAGRWSRRLDAAFGRTQSGGFVVGVEHPEDASLVLSALEEAEGNAEPAARVLGRVDALTRVLPGSAEEQQRKLRMVCELRALLQRAKDCGATKAFINMLRLPGSVAPYFEQRLREKLPTRADRVLNRIRDARGGKLNSSVFGERMRGKGQYWNAQEKLFEVYCRRLGFNEHRVGSDSNSEEKTFRRPTTQGSLFA